MKYGINMKHGGSTRQHGKTREYVSWLMMRQRCFDPRYTYYRNYGGRGITVCSRWDHFAYFLADMGMRPIGTSLERLNVNGDYSPDNCRWESRRKQSRNCRNNIWVEYKGERIMLLDLCTKLKLSYTCIYQRYRAGKYQRAE